jgi:hypothetical protein
VLVGSAWTVLLIEWHDNHARRVAARQTRRGDQP